MPCYGQNRNRRKNKEPEVPKIALLPTISAAQFEKQVKDFVNDCAEFPFPASAQEYKKNAAKFPELTPGKIRQKVIAFRYVVQHPDLEEVTKHKRGWYIKLYNAALPLISAADKLYDLRTFPSAKKYQEVRNIFTNVSIRLDEIYDEKPQKLTRDQLIQITNKNRERRKKEWLKKYYAEQKQKALEAKKAPAVKDKKNNKSSRRQKKESAR